MSSPETRSQSLRPPMREYAAVAAILGATVLLIVQVTAAPAQAVAPAAIIPPVVALVALTGLVLLLTVVVRNVGVLRGTISARYYRDYITDLPAEKLERPARTFNNLLQVPLLFYVLVAFMLITGQVDSVQVTLAFCYVAARVLHAFIYIAFNIVAYRFSVYIGSCIILGVMWTRFALEAWP